jgi:D-glycero-D-manno-heptose 1,7-bisphosphate phosphatase
MKNKALFLDRDGVINAMVYQKNNSFDSPQSSEQVALVQDIDCIILYCNQNKIPVIEITNQPGVAKNKIDLSTLNAIERQVHTLLLEKKVWVDATYRCLHHPAATNLIYKQDCACRKPKPGMLLQAAHDLAIDLTASILIGDTSTDMDAGKAAGCTTILYTHENDEAHKVAMNKAYEPHYRVYSHQEALKLIQKIL